MIQYRRKMLEDAHNQRWYYREDGFIYPQVDPNLVLDIRVSWKKTNIPYLLHTFQGNWTKPGTVVLLYERKYSDNENQLWDLIPDTDDGSSASILLREEEDGDDDYSFSTSSYAL